jgi:PAS domain S-box-containing protein
LTNASGENSETLLRQQSALVRFGELALKSNDLDEILTEACRLVAEALGTDLAKVVELQADGQTLLVRAGVGWKPGVVGKTAVKLTDMLSESHALKTGEPMISPNIDTENRFRYPTFLLEHGVKAVANVAILGGKGRPPYGVLQIDSGAPRRFTDNDTNFLRSYANLLAAAVERMRSVAEVRSEETRFRTLAEGIPQLVFEARAGGDRSWSSPQWVAYTGMSEKDARGFGWLAAIHPEDREATMAAWAEADAKAGLAVDHRIRRAADGAYRWFQTRALPVRDEAGRISEWMGTATDIEDQVRAREVLTRDREQLETLVAERTAELRHALDALHAEIIDREQAEEALRQAQKIEAIGQLTGGIAHDFNNMLQGIAGSLEMASRRIGAGRAAEALRQLDGARQRVDRAAGLTRRLLAFARRQRLEPRPVEPDALVAGMADLIRRTMGPAVRLELRLRDGAAKVLCDPGELESALLNLCINSRDAMPDGGRLTISTQDLQLSAKDVLGHEGAQPGAYVAIAVKDTGQGMPPEIRARAFEPFFTTKPQGQGTGLGLSQVFGFVRQSDGVMQLESVLGEGTTIRLCLPFHEIVEPADQQIAVPLPQGNNAGKLVLLVDDEAGVRETVAEYLGERGFRVVEAADGPAALRLMDSGVRPNVLVSDVGLPGGMNGRQVAEACRERFPELPVLFITGYAATQLPPGSDVIGKPFTFDVFVHRINLLLERGGGATDGPEQQAAG